MNEYSEECILTFLRNQEQLFTEPVAETEEEAEALEIPEIGAGRTQIYVDAIEKAVKLIEDRPVFAGVIGPFSLAGRLMDVTEAMIYC